MSESDQATAICSALARDPASLLEFPYDAGLELAQEALQAAQLGALRRRFQELRPRVAALGSLATKAGIHSLEKLEDVVPLLFAHTAFKSYPLAWLDEGRFDLLTDWLRRFTTHMLPKVEASQFTSLDEWVDHLDAHSQVRVVHTFGTSGKLSWIPRSAREWDLGARILANSIRDFHGVGSGVDLQRAGLPLVQPGFQYGANAATRAISMFEKHFCRGQESLFLYPGQRFSADMVSRAGRLRTRQATGGDQDTESPSALIDVRDRFGERGEEYPRRMRQFLETMLDRHRCRDVLLFGVWPTLYDWMEAGRQMGISRVFGSGSVLVTGGGTKGRDLPVGWRHSICEFLGFDRYMESYAMTELIAGCPRCESGNFHVPPVIIPFVLDPVTGIPLDRALRATGRFAFFDLLAESTWSAISTGDEVTLSGRDESCECGRAGRFVYSDIRRYGALDGGDDKVLCGGANDAHASAAALLARAS